MLKKWSNSASFLILNYAVLFLNYPTTNIFVEINTEAEKSYMDFSNASIHQEKLGVVHSLVEKLRMPNISSNNREFD